jgi:hypothetical protein
MCCDGVKSTYSPWPVECIWEGEEKPVVASVNLFFFCV